MAPDGEAPGAGAEAVRCWMHSCTRTGARGSGIWRGTRREGKYRRERGCRLLVLHRLVQQDFNPAHTTASSVPAVTVGDLELVSSKSAGITAQLLQE